MKKLMYLLALPIGLGLLWGFTVKVVEVAKATERDEKTFTLVLDAGHGGKEKGAVVNGISEKDITLAMAKKIKKLAEAKGIKVVTTREVDENVSIKDRVKANGDILISLHVNSEPTANGGKRNGIEMYTAVMDGTLKVQKANSFSRSLFKGMQHIKGINIKDQRQAKSLALLRETKVPGIILELGYLTNKNDLKFITDEAKQNELATGIVDGILLYKEKIPSDEELARSKYSYFKYKLTKPQTSFIEVEKMTFAGNRPGFYVFVKSTNGKKMQTVGTEGMMVKFLINGKLYSLDEAKNFDKNFVDNLDAHQGGGRGYYYNVPGVANEEYVFWFGKEPTIQASVALSKSASSRYTGKSVYGQVLGYSYNSKNNEIDGFILQQKNDERLKIFIDPKFAKLITKQIQISDEIKVKAFNAYFVNGAKFPEIGSSTISKNGKVIFDRAKVVIDARPEGLKTDYSTLSKIEYLSSDSITFSNDRKIVDLYGKASLNLDSIQLNANHININNSTKIITAKDAKITSKFNNVNVIAPIIYYNLKTKSYNVQQLKGTYK